MRGTCKTCGREKMLHFCEIGLHCNDCEKKRPCDREGVSAKLREAAADLRQAAEDLEVDGDVDGSELDAIGDVVAGAMSLIVEVARERKGEAE